MKYITMKHIAPVSRENEKQTGQPEILQSAQEIMHLSKKKFIIAGAKMMAKALYVRFPDTKHSSEQSEKTIINTIKFFASDCRRSDIEAFIYGSYDGIEFEKCGKWKKEYRPTKVWFDLLGKQVNPYEFMEEDEEQMEEKSVFEQLKRESLYAQRSLSKELLYKTYGKAQMAIQLAAITQAEFMEINHMTVYFMNTDREYIKHRNME